VRPRPRRAITRDGYLADDGWDTTELPEKLFLFSEILTGEAWRSRDGCLNQRQTRGFPVNLAQTVLVFEALLSWELLTSLNP